MDTKLIFATISVMITLCRGDLASDISTHTVELEFYRLQVADWETHGMQTKVAAILASGANNYCSANPNICGFVTCCDGTAFKEINIGKDANAAVNEEKNMLFSFHITIPDGSSLVVNETYVLTSAVVIRIVENVRIDVFNSIGYYITWADETYFGVPTTRNENIILTIIAFLVLIIVIIIALFLHFWNKRREHNEKLMKKIEDKKAKKNKKKGEEEEGKAGEGSGEGYKIEKETGPIPVPDKLKSRTVTPARKSIYGGEKEAGASKLPSSKAKGMVSDTDSAIKMDDPKSNGDIEESAARRQAEKSHALPPLKTSEARKEDEVDEKKKKRKAKRKHRKSKRTANENAGYQPQSDDEVTDL